MKITRRWDGDLASASRETSTRRSRDAGRHPRHRWRPVRLTNLRQTGFCRRSNPEASDHGVGSTEREVQPHPKIETRPVKDKFLGPRSSFVEQDWCELGLNHFFVTHIISCNIHKQSLVKLMTFGNLTLHIYNVKVDCDTLLLCRELKQWCKIIYI